MEIFSFFSLFVQEVRKVNESIKYNHPLRKCVDTILKKVMNHIGIYFPLKYNFYNKNIRKVWKQPMTEVFATAFHFHGNTDHKSVVMCTQNLFLCITSLTLIIGNVLL